ncbi:hypothetical protein N2C79_14015 [Enterococcus faecalis]|nr:hypothetical protein [Enterococcus faecalis]
MQLFEEQVIEKNLIDKLLTYKNSWIKMNKKLKKGEVIVMKKLLVLILGVSFISVALSSTTEASAREWDSIECQPGFYWKKGGWTAGGYHKAGGFCIPMHTRWTK